MRSISKMASLALLALPLVSFSSSARADNNDLMNQGPEVLQQGQRSRCLRARSATTRCAASRRIGIGNAGAANTTGT